MKNAGVRIVISVLAVVGLSEIGHGQASTSFERLGQLPGWTGSYAAGVSGDGSVVVGHVERLGADTRAFRWTAAGGMEDLGTLGGNNSESSTTSSDGSVVVGSASNSSGNYRAFRWTLTGGMSDIGTDPPEFLSGYADDVSANGSAVVGLLGFADRWTEAGGFEDLGDFTARGVSGDGLVVVGYKRFGSYNRAVRWTPAGGLHELGTVGGTESFGDAVSADGSVVVGQSRDRDGFWKAIRWTQSQGMQDLGTMGGPMSAAYDVSSDGTVVVGTSLINSGSTSHRAFRWTTRKQMQDLRQLLLDAGVTEIQNWILSAATGVSADGRMIVGYGFSPEKQWEAFRVVLPLPQ